MKILVFGVIYNGIENYLEDYFASLERQTYKNFDILIIEDGFHLPERFLLYNLFTIESGAKSKISDIRLTAIEFAKKNNYKILIFTDCDDFFSENRIENTIKSLNYADFCVNRLVLVNESGLKMGGININSIPKKVDVNQILCANYFGLSNTAIKIDSLPKDFYIPADLVVVDWWIYTLLLLNNRNYFFDENTTTFYRQHSNNLVGHTLYLDKARLLKGIEIKAIHYKNILQYCENFGFDNYCELVKKYICENNELKISTEDENFIEHYLSVINANILTIKTGWWSEILPLSVWRKYE